jgi:hypothetical protein
MTLCHVAAHNERAGPFMDTIALEEGARIRKRGY